MKNQIIPIAANYKKVSLFCVFILFVYQIQAQQAPHYAQYLYNIQVINPAFVGEKSDFNAALLSRWQWVGVEGSPKTTTFSTNGRLRNGVGLGATAIREEIGLARITEIDLDASYTTVLSNRSRLSVGLKGGLGFFNNNLDNAITVDGEIYEPNSDQYVDIGFGLLYKTKKFFVAFSAPNLIKAPVFNIDVDSRFSQQARANNYFITAGVAYSLSRFYDIKFTPSTLIKYVPSLPLSIDANANFVFNKKYEFGLSYRLQNSVSAVAAIITERNFRIGYAYELQLMQIGGNLSSHEVILRLDLNFKRRKRWLFEDCCNF